MRIGRPCRWLLLLVAIIGLVASAKAQGGPPLLTNDPIPPEHGNWEVNLGTMPEITATTTSVQLIQIDLNYGLTDRVELICELPFVWQASTGEPSATGWDNALPGVKVRLVNGGKDGWNFSTFPQVQIGGSAESVRKGVAEQGTRFLLPFEVSKRFGPVNVNFEAGYFFPFDASVSHEERILGLALGHKFKDKFELLGEIYDDKEMGSSRHDVTFDGGGRYEFHKGLLLLFMSGRSFAGSSSGQPEFLGYGGIRILLDHYGARLHEGK